MKNTTRSTIFIAAVVSLGGFLFGFDASVISGVQKYIEPQFALSKIQLGWVVSAPSFAAMFAMLIAGTVSDFIGRKKVLLIVAFLYALSAIWSAYAGGYTDLVIARMLGGLAFGAALVLAPVYIAEIAPAHARGKLVSIQQLNIVLGFSAAYFSNYFLQNSLDSGSSSLTDETIWRWMFGIEFFPAIIYFLALFFVPRSPRWLFTKEKKEEAKNVLTKLHGAALAQEEAINIERNLKQAAAQKKVSLKNLFHKSLHFVLLVGLTVGILQQITGINAVFFYANSIFEQSGVGTNAAFTQAVWVGIINVVFTLIAMALIDKMGRKPLLLIGIGGIALSMCLTAYGFKQATYQLTPDKIASIKGVDQAKLNTVANRLFDNDLDFKNTLKNTLGEIEYNKYEGDLVQAAINMNPFIVLIGILCFVASFAMSLGPVMWVMLSELFPNYIRGLAISAIGFINSGTSWLVQFIFPWELANFGNALTYLIYAAFGIIGFFLFLKILPETKGKSLEEIEREYVKS